MNVTSFAAFVLATSATALAQCELQPTATGRGVPSLDDTATCLCEWDPDGAGPLGPLLVVGGLFTLAGDLPANGIAAFDPATGQWSPLGTIDGQVQALAVLPNGQLVAGGQFSTSGPGGSTLRLWTGSSWSSAIAQPNALTITALAVAPTGELHATGFGGLGTAVQRLSGGSWQPLGMLTPATPIEFVAMDCLAFATNGDLLVGGIFGSIDGVAANCVARWNGSVWSPLGSGLVGRVHALLATSTGGVFAGGLFGTSLAASSTSLAQWNGSVWTSVGAGTQSSIAPFPVGALALAEFAGNVVVAGQFDSMDGVPVFKVAQWNGTAWSAMGTGIEPSGPSLSAVVALQRTSNGELFAGGLFATVGGRDSSGLARWNGSAWSPLRSLGIGRATSAVHRTAGGDVYLAGAFRDLDGVVCNGIARRVGNGWQPLGTGLAALEFGPQVAAIRSLPNGSIVVGGTFETIGGSPIAALAVWNGSAWSPLGGGLATAGGNAPTVAALHIAANGDLYVAGQFDSAGGVAVNSLARWNGSQWSAVATGLGPASLTAVTTGPAGEVYIAGQFLVGGGIQSGQVAVRSGGSWQTIGGADGPVHELIGLPGGTLLAAGRFQRADGQVVGCVARWAGGVWAPFGGLGTTGPFNAVRRLVPLPSGGLLAAGLFPLPTGNGFAALAQWDGASWRLSVEGFAEATDLAFDPSGEVLVAGGFRTVGGVASAYFARVVAPCAATAIAAGTGCTGSGGQNQLAASAAPWLGTTWIATASGMPSNGVAATVLGLGTTNVPLSSLLPQGGAGCALLVTPDALGLALPSGGVAQVALPLSLVPAFAGIALQLQVVPIEFGVGGAITVVTSTNRLAVTLGVF
jgi:hypothetical protein